MDAFLEHKKMISKGLMWKCIDKEIPFDKDRPIEMLSKRNMRILKDKVGYLTEEERNFMNSILGQPWHLTYFSSKENFYGRILSDKGTVRLKSFDRRLQDDSMSAVGTSAAYADVEQFANTNFVFFCLELGTSLKKKQTRSPGRSLVIRTILDQEPMKYAMSMHGDIFDGLRAGRRMMIPDEDLLALNNHLSRFESDPLNDDNGFARTVFYGIKYIKEGTVLQIILDIRRLRESVRSEVLARRGSRDLNDIVTSLSRTQVMVPEECVLDNYKVFDAA
jgi:hypothetical protein